MDHDAPVIYGLEFQVAESSIAYSKHSVDLKYAVFGTCVMRRGGGA